MTVCGAAHLVQVHGIHMNVVEEIRHAALDDNIRFRTLARDGAWSSIRSFRLRAHSRTRLFDGELAYPLGFPIVQEPEVLLPQSSYSASLCVADHDTHQYQIDMYL